MRLIKKFEEETLAKRFSMFLQKQKIENTLDVEMDNHSKKMMYPIWIHDEDVMDKAQQYLQDFEKDSQNAKFDVPLEEIYPIKEEETMEEKEPQESSSSSSSRPSFLNLTSFFLILCVFIYLLNYYQEDKIKKDNKQTFVLFTPITKALLFDETEIIFKINEIIQKYQIDPHKDLKKQSPKAYQELEAIEKEPFWKGFYEIIILKKKYPQTKFSLDGRMFAKIRQGQIWRIFSPCILHISFLHLLFNMLWLWLLGKQIEQRLSKIKYLILIISIGIISNLSQYLMSGPLFLGFSGVIMGMVGFIWARQKIAPWEGYPLQKEVFLFIGIYVLLMFVLSFFSFVTEFIGADLFTPSIGNTAHIAGALVGYVLGRLSFFSWRPNHER